MTKPSYWALGLGIVLEFAAVLAILLKIFPKPMKQTDYLVVGTLATFVALGTLFAILLSTTMRDPTAFRRSLDSANERKAEDRTSETVERPTEDG